MSPKTINDLKYSLVILVCMDLLSMIIFFTFFKKFQTYLKFYLIDFLANIDKISF